MNFHSIGRDRASLKRCQEIVLISQRSHVNNRRYDKALTVGRAGKSEQRGSGSSGRSPANSRSSMCDEVLNSLSR